MNQAEQQATSNSHPLFIARTLIFIRNHSRFLFIKGSPHKHIGSNLYNAIGGHIEKNESIIDSAFRELFEETGLSQQNIHDLHLIGAITITLPANSPNIILFVLSGFSHTTNVKESSEGSLHWLTPEEISEETTMPDIPALIQRILQAGDTISPFTAHYWYDENDKLQIKFSAQDDS